MDQDDRRENDRNKGETTPKNLKKKLDKLMETNKGEY